MKKLSFLLLTLCVVFFSACKKEENALSNKEKVVGKWQYDYIKTENYQDGTFIKSEKEAVNNREIDFRADETYFINYAENGEYTQLAEGTWRAYGSNNLIFDEAMSENSKFDIKELSSTRLTIFIKVEVIERGETYEQELEISYKR